MNNYNFEVRLTGLLIISNKILLVKQKLNSNRDWSLPGGRLEHGEQMETALIREILEETGINVKIEKAVSLSDVYPYNKVIHIGFFLKKTGGEIKLLTNEYDENPILDVRFIEISKLCEYGFDIKFIDFIKSMNFNKVYLGDKRSIGLS